MTLLLVIVVTCLALSEIQGRRVNDELRAINRSLLTRVRLFQDTSLRTRRDWHSAA